MASRWLLTYPAWLPLTSATSATVSGRSDSCQKFRISRCWPLSSSLKSSDFEICRGRAVAVVYRAGHGDQIDIDLYIRLDIFLCGGEERDANRKQRGI